MSVRPLKVGIQLPEVEREVRWPELLDMIRAIEDGGFDSIWLGEHLLYRWSDRPEPAGPWEAWTMLAGVAAVTSRVEFGPLVACTGFHNPALLAKQAATIDEISGGRLILGLGAGWNETEFRAFGFPFDHRVDRFEEAFTIIRTLLREGAIDFDGRFYQARDCELRPRGPRPGGPPLLIGSNGPRMLRITMPHAAGLEQLVRRHRQRPSRGRAAARRWSTRRAATSAAIPAEIERTVAVFVQLPGGRRPRPGRLRWAAANHPAERAAGGDGGRPASLRRRGDRPRPAGRRSRSRRGSIDALVPVLRVARRGLTDPVPPYRAERRPVRASIARAMRTVTTRGVRSLAVIALVAVATSACGSPPPSASPVAVATPLITPDPHLADPTTADVVFRALGSGGLRITATNAASGTDGDEPVKRINASYLGWPLIVSQYSSSAALHKATAGWQPGDRPGQGEPPIALTGLNILVTGARRRAPSPRRRTTASLRRSR